MDGDGGVRQVRQVRLSDEDAIVCQVNQIEAIRWVNQVGEGVRSKEVGASENMVVVPTPHSTHPLTQQPILSLSCVVS